MPKLLADSKKIEIKLNDRVTVRTQTERPVDDRQLNQLKSAHCDSVRRNKLALDEVNKLITYLENLHEDKIPADGLDKFKKIFEMLSRHFKIDRTISVEKTLHHLKRISTRLTQINEGLSNDKSTLYISNVARNPNNNDRYGYVHKEFIDRIYLNFNLLRNDISTEFIMLVLIHEASHLFANTEDHAYYHSQESIPNRSLFDIIYSKNNLRAITDKDITFFKRMDNADSIAYFVTELTGEDNKYSPPESYIHCQNNTHQINTNNIFGRIETPTMNTSDARKILQTGLLIGTAFALHTATIRYSL